MPKGVMTAVCILDDCGKLQRRFPYCSKHLKRLERNGTVRQMRPEDWFLRHVTEASDCWEYSPVHPVTGYAQFTVDNGQAGVRAHRWSYEFFVGDIPDGLEIDHLCSNRACVNPAHLEPVTHRVNLQRARERSASAA